MNSKVLVASAVLIVWPGIALRLDGQVSQPSTPSPLSAADFPPSDASVWRLLQNGETAKAESRLRADQPDSPEITSLLRQDRIDDALRVLRAIVDRYPEQIPRAFEIVAEGRSHLRDQARGHPEALQALVKAARQQLPRLSREDAARAERQLLLIDPSTPGTSFTDQLRDFVREYAGTEAALLTEVDVIVFGRPAMSERLSLLDEFIAAHKGTIVGAKALRQKGFQLASNAAVTGFVPRGGDPTDRFMQVLEIVKELESGQYPPCEWVDAAPMLVRDFYASNPTYAPGNLERLLAAHEAFLATHLALDEPNPVQGSSGGRFTERIADLLKRKGEGVSGMEQVFSRLEEKASDPARVRYLRAKYYIANLNTEPVADRSMLFQKAIGTLQALYSQGGHPYQRKALATLASLYFSERDYANARSQFRTFLDAYPDSGWAWVAALRIGQCDEALGNWSPAVTSYLAAASRYASVPIARALGYAYAARGDEAIGRFDRALGEHQQALANWDPDYGSDYALYAAPTAQPRDPFLARNASSVAREVLSLRIIQLTRSLSLPGGTLLERGRWEFDHERWDAAVLAFDQVLRQFPRSAAASEARDLGHRAKLTITVAGSDLGNPNVDESAALKRVEELIQDPHDFGVFAAQMAKASLLWKRGAPEEAEVLMTQASQQWQSARIAAAGAAALSEMERDVVAIRTLVIRPSVDGDQGFSAWSRLSSGIRVPPLLFVNPDLTVRLANGSSVSVSLPQPVTGAGNVIFVNAEQASFIRSLSANLGRSGGRAPTGSSDIRGFWSRFFPEGSVFGTAPTITQLEFLDAGRSRAAARIAFGSRGGTLLLEKENGTWTAKSLVNQWIS